MPRFSEEEMEEMAGALYAAKEELLRGQRVALQKNAIGVAKKFESMIQKVDRLYRYMRG
jgi:hypothetical protein